MASAACLQARNREGGLVVLAAAATAAVFQGGDD